MDMTCKAALGLGFCLLLPATAGAAEAPVAPLAADAQTWHFSLSPYLWGAGVEGDVGHKRTGKSHVKLDFSDVARNLDVAFMGLMEARKGPYSLLADMMYIDSTTKTQLPSSRLDTKSKTASGFLGAGYMLLQAGESHLDAIAGGRIWYSKTTLALHGGAIDGTARSDSATWVDAVAGARGHYALTEHVFLTGWGTVGAGQARVDWDVAGLLGYQFGSAVAVLAGYRAIGVNYQHDGFVYDMVQQGPVMGMTVRF
jgi:hypothetical protein